MQTVRNGDVLIPEGCHAFRHKPRRSLKNLRYRVGEIREVLNPELAVHRQVEVLHVASRSDVSFRVAELAGKCRPNFFERRPTRHAAGMKYYLAAIGRNSIGQVRWIGIRDQSAENVNRNGYRFVWVVRQWSLWMEAGLFAIVGTRGIAMSITRNA